MSRLTICLVICFSTTYIQAESSDYEYLGEQDQWNGIQRELPTVPQQEPREPDEPRSVHASSSDNFCSINRESIPWHNKGMPECSVVSPKSYHRCSVTGEAAGHPTATYCSVEGIMNGRCSVRSDQARSENLSCSVVTNLGGHNEQCSVRFSQPAKQEVCSAGTQRQGKGKAKHGPEGDYTCSIKSENEIGMGEMSCSVLSTGGSRGSGRSRSRARAHCSVRSSSRFGDMEQPKTYCSIDGVTVKQEGQLDEGAMECSILNNSDYATCSIDFGGGPQVQKGTSACSVTKNINGGVDNWKFSCSVYSSHDGQGFCSVKDFQKTTKTINSNLQCSVTDGNEPSADPKCSVIKANNEENACSVKRSDFNSASCSVLTTNGADTCSVYEFEDNGQTKIHGKCSVIKSGKCSILKSNDKACTVFGGEAQDESRCSLHGVGENDNDSICSIIKEKKGPEGGICGKKPPGAPPSPPIIESVQSPSNNNTPMIYGNATSGMIIHLYLDQSFHGSTQSNGGVFSFEVYPALNDGEHSVYAVAEDSEGQTSEPSNTVYFVIDTVIGKPVIAYPADGSVISDSTPVIEGAGTDPGAVVEVYLDENLIAITTAGPAGEFSAPVTSALADGEHAVYASAMDEAGNTTVSDTVLFTVDTVVGTPLLDPIGVTGDSTPAISGSGTDPGASIAVVVDEELAGTTNADGVGNFSVTVAEPLADGIHTAYAVASDEAGNTATSETIEFTVDTVAPDAPVILFPEPGGITSKTPTIEGKAEPGAAVTVYIDGLLSGSTECDPAGFFAFKAPGALTEEWHTVYAQAVDAAGHVSEPSRTIEFFADPPPPHAKGKKKGRKK